MISDKGNVSFSFSKSCEMSTFPFEQEEPCFNAASNSKSLSSSPNEVLEDIISHSNNRSARDVQGNHCNKVFKSSKATWSVKNRIQGKTWGEYIKRQNKIARKICNHLFKMFNNQDVEGVLDFIDRYYAEEIIYEENTKGIHPLTGETDTTNIVRGIEAIKGVSKLMLTTCPDILFLVDAMEVLNNGKTVRIELATVATPMHAISANDWVRGVCDVDVNRGGSISRSKETYVTSCVIEIHLNSQNKIVKIVNNSTHKTSNVFN